MPAVLRRTLLLRGAALWLFTRLTVLAVVAAANADVPEALLPLWTPVVSSILVLVDLHRRKELSLLHNLGIPTSAAVLVGTLPAVVLETLLLAPAG